MCRKSQNINLELELYKEAFAKEKDERKRSEYAIKVCDIYFNKASNKSEQGDHQSAIRYYLNANEYSNFLDDITVFHTHINTGVEYEEIENYDQAIYYYKKALSLNLSTDEVSQDEMATLFKYIGSCYDKKKEEFETFRYYQKLFSIKPDYDGGWYLAYRYATLCYNYREFSAALKYFNVSLEQIPNKEKIYIESTFQYIGNIYTEKKLYKKAISSFKEVLKIKSEFGYVAAESLLGIAQAYFGLSKFNQAIKYAKMALDAPHYDLIKERVYFYLAFSYSVKKNKKLEQYYTNKLEEFRPDSPYLEDLRYGAS